MTNSRQGLVWVATIPEGLRCSDQSRYPRVLSHLVGQVAVMLEGVQCSSLVKMRLRGGELSKKEQCFPQHCMNHEGQSGILLSLRDEEELFPQGERCGVIPSHIVKCPQPKQDLRDLQRLPHLQT